ncbi:MAG: N-acetyltransferase [Planctomycetes bacterium]|nr:N-acetyltransferase [Planctomycetota bacterium]
MNATIRKANVNDPPAIAELVNHFAAQEKMLPRPLNDVYEALRDFFIWEENNEILGCAALHVTWEGLGEIRSLAVREEAQGLGIGKKLVNACLEEAPELGMNKVFVLTYLPDFFREFGFENYDKNNLPHKVWSDCLKCPKFPNCDEIAMILKLSEKA